MNPGDSKTPYDRSVELRPSVVVLVPAGVEGCSSCRPCATAPASAELTIVRLPPFGLTGFGLAVNYPN